MGVGFFSRVRAGLKKTRQILTTPVSELFVIGRRVDEALLEQLEEKLILADVGPRLAMEITDQVRQKYRNKEIVKGNDVMGDVKAMIRQHLNEAADGEIAKAESGPTVILMVGVNGTGKTTTTAKLAQLLKTEMGRTVLLAAGDTFRAAAGEQLDIWAGRIGVDIVRHADGADPAAVVYDACEAAKARGVDFVIVDTAGRLHTKNNLMQQLEKIHRVAGRQIPGAPHEVLLVLDATTGQNALSQAKLFSQGVGVTGLVLTKLDGTAKGGIALAIHREVSIPIKYIGTGETAADFAPFDAMAYLDAMFETDTETVSN